jgi:hypothetical protein
MSSETSVQRFSTVAHFELIVDGRSYKVTHVASEFILLDTAADIPPGPATLVIRVENEEIRRAISLPAGANAQSPRVEIVRERAGP